MVSGGLAVGIPTVRIHLCPLSLTCTVINAAFKGHNQGKKNEEPLWAWTEKTEKKKEKRKGKGKRKKKKERKKKKQNIKQQNKKNKIKNKIIIIIIIKKNK